MPSTTAGLAEPLKSKIDQLLAEAGGRVTIVSGLRSRSQQIALRRAHCGTSHYDIYEKPASQCSPPTAKPGTSKHETGEAVDLGGDLTMASRIGQRLGLSTPVKGEPWHFEADGLRGPAAIRGVTSGILDLGGDVVEAAVNPLLEGLQRVLITGLFLAAGVGLVVAGGYRGVTGRKLTSDLAEAGSTAATLAATGGTAAARRTA